MAVWRYSLRDTMQGAGGEDPRGAESEARPDRTSSSSWRSRHVIGYATNANRVLSGDQLFTLRVPWPPNSG
jgi:hypothetical protein